LYRLGGVQVGPGEAKMKLKRLGLTEVLGGVLQAE
jgi:hypothetical protein